MAVISDFSAYSAGQVGFSGTGPISPALSMANSYLMLECGSRRVVFHSPAPGREPGVTSGSQARPAGRCLAAGGVGRVRRTHASHCPSSVRRRCSRALIRNGRGMFPERARAELGLKCSEALVQGAGEGKECSVTAEVCSLSSLGQHWKHLGW